MSRLATQISNKIGVVHRRFCAVAQLIIQLPGISALLADLGPCSLMAATRRVTVKSDRDDTRGDGRRRRKILECMTWAGTGGLWTVIGGVPRSVSIVGSAQDQSVKGLSFLQISDSHVGFDKP